MTTEIETLQKQRSAAIKRRKEIWEALNIQVAKVWPPEIGYGKPPPQTEAFAAATAATSGMAKSSINQHLARAEVLGADLQAVVGTSLDKGVELDALKAMPVDQRLALIARAQAGEQVTARPPKVEITLRITGDDMASEDAA